ncbi:MAG: N-acetylmuramoyl-L-alanine amidase [Angelakisella sp.]
MKEHRAVSLFILSSMAVVGILLLILPHLNQQMHGKAASVAQDSRPVVVLDAGHGGFDGGAQANNINEKEINLALVLKEARLCRLFGFEPVLTRSTDSSIHDEGSATVREKKRSDMRKRLAMMIADPQSVAVSIHLNKFPQSAVHGAQVFYAPRAVGSDLLAQTIQDSFKLLLQPENNREIKKADKDLFLLYNNESTPAVIVECGFISNPAEAAQLKSEQYQEQVAMTICYALLKFQSRGEVTEYAP